MTDTATSAPGEPEDDNHQPLPNSGNNVRASWNFSLDSVRAALSKCSSEAREVLVACFLWCIDDQHPLSLPEFAKAIGGCVPGLSKEDLYWRLDFLSGALTYAMADFGLIKRPAGVSEASHRQRAAKALIRFAAAGFHADAA